MATLLLIVHLLIVGVGAAGDGSRPGSPSNTHSCNDVTSVPDDLRSADVMRPNGLDQFYQKYTQAYGIPILGSSNAQAEALKRACYLVRFLLADHAPVRHMVYRLSGRFAVFGAGETPESIPEHATYGTTSGPAWGATFWIPVSSTAGTNLLCDQSDSHTPESIALHEMAHMLHRLGAEFAIDGWNDRLKASYTSAKANGLWSNTYAQKDYIEYFAEGVQSYFDDNWRVEKADGHHNNISTRKQLMNYDPQLHGVIDELFPCKNTLLARCSSTREEEQNQILKMDCVPYVASPTDPACKDTTVKCMAWASTGECQKNPGWMNNSCALSCKQCTPNNG